MFNSTPQGRSLLNIAIPPADQLNVVTPTTPSPYPLGRADSGKLLLNATATGTVTALLPSDANIGDHFEVMEVAAQNIVLDPTALNGQATGTNATGSITDGASKSTATTGLYTASAQGSSCELVCIGAGPAWQVIRKQGTWTVT